MEAHRAEFDGQETMPEVNEIGFDSYEDPLPEADEPDPVDSLTSYLRDIGRNPLLTADEEKMYAKQMETGMQAQKLLDSLSVTNTSIDNELLVLYGLIEQGRLAKKTMINSNLRLVVSIAKRSRGYGLPFLDLIQEGTIGLNRAVEKFDYKKGYKFSTYATWWIRQAVGRGIADKGRVIRIPVHLAEKHRKINDIKVSFAQIYNREPLIEEIAYESGISVEEITKILKIPETTSLEAPVGDGDSVLGEFLENDEADNPEKQAILDERKAKLDEVLSKLSDRDRLVLEMRYGLNGKEPETLEDIGKAVGVTRERVRQIENGLLKELAATESAQSLKEVKN